MEKLWNRNFAILTIGSFVSAVGSCASGIGFAVLIYEQTGSALMLALFTVANAVPRILTGFLAGPFVDRHSRVRIIYALDFVCAACFTGLAAALFLDFYNTWVFTALAAFFGIVDTVYQLAFMTAFPEAVPNGSHHRAYSIASLLWPVAGAIMSPLAVLIRDTVDHGIAWLMAINAATYLIAALFEVTMKLPEHLNTKEPIKFQFVEDFREGFHYFRTEKGILWITILFTVFNFGYGVHGVLTMPLILNGTTFLTLMDYAWIGTANSIGRIIGSIAHYFIVYPPKKRFRIAIFVYFIVEIFACTVFYLPFLWIILAINFVDGLLAVTSYTIRTAATQVYIPGTLRGRINSTQSFLWNIGSIIGVLAAGFAAEYTSFDYRVLFLFSAVITIGAIIFIPLRRKKEFEQVYNAEI